MSKDELLNLLDAEIDWWSKSVYRLQRARRKKWLNADIQFVGMPNGGNPETIKQLLQELGDT